MVARVTSQDRQNRSPQRLPDNVVPFAAHERRAPQKWWERAKAGELYGRDEQGVGRIVVGRGGEAA